MVEVWRYRAKLGYGPLGRGLFALSDIEPGAVVLEVPLDLCIIRQLDASEANIKVDGQMSITQRKQLCWILEFFLTAELLQAVSEGGEEFWLRYKRFLPPSDFPFPMLLKKVSIFNRGNGRVLYSVRGEDLACCKPNHLASAAGGDGRPCTLRRLPRAHHRTPSREACPAILARTVPVNVCSTDIRTRACTLSPAC